MGAEHIANVSWVIPIWVRIPSVPLLNGVGILAVQGTFNPQKQVQFLYAVLKECGQTARRLTFNQEIAGSTPVTPMLQYLIDMLS